MRNLVIILLFFSNALFSADGISRHYYPQNHYWGLILGIGGGDSIKDDFGGFTSAIIPSYQHGKHIFNLRHSRVFEFYMEGPRPERLVVDTSFLYGRCKKGNFYYTSFSAGPGFVQGMKRGKLLSQPGLVSNQYEELPFTAIGLSMDAQFFVLTPNVGFGAYIFGSLNSEQPYFAALLCLQFGYLVDKW